MTIHLHAAGAWEELPRDRTAAATAGDLVWLGQAGFLLHLSLRVDTARHQCTLLLDPYLSDSLAKKYAGTELPHIRLTPPPLGIDELPPVDLVLCSHRHSDHMDPETLSALARSQPECRFVVPQALTRHASSSLEIDADRLLGVDADVPFEPLPGLIITPVLAAHETLDFDDCGHSRNLGYVIATQDLRIYHSGDCVPYPTQEATLSTMGIQVALLPINGRDGYRLSHGVPGNFHPREAVGLASAAGVDVLLGHHFGLFDFNTVNEADLGDALLDLPAAVQWVRPRLGERYEIRALV
jgi:L-ascorbate metabolism protein UlaG (beta-lactamase superfamily)